MNDTEQCAPPGAVDRAALENFERDGFCLVKNLLRPSDFAPVRRAYEGVLHRICRDLKAAGRIARDYAELPFLDRYLQITRETGGVFAQHFTIALPQGGITADTPIVLAPEVFDLLTHPRILDAVEAFLGPEIAVSPVGNVRIKPPDRLMLQAHDGDRQRPGLFRATPWHQDNGVVTAEADAAPMLTVWFSLTEATLESGCLQVLPGSHRQDLIRHCPDHNGELSIPAALLPKPEPMPLPAGIGDVLFLHRRLCHAALPNVSEHIRWSFDLRYIPAGCRSGRELFPTFTARSRAHPERELRNPEQWADRWLQTRAALAGNAPPRERWNRWHADAEGCA